MAENNFWVNLVASLKKGQSKKQIQTDAKNLGEIKVPLVGTLDKAKTRAQLKKDLASLNGTVKLTGKFDQKGLDASVQQAAQKAQKKAKAQPVEIDFNIRKDKLINDIKILAQQNSKMFKDAGMAQKYNQLLDNAKLAVSNKQIQSLRLQLSAMRSEIRAMNLSGLTLGDTFKRTFQRAAELFAGTGGVMLATQQLRKAWAEALNLDKAYTDLIKVQDQLSRSDYPDYLDRCNKKAQELAATQKGLIEGAAEFSKSGYNLSTSNKLTEKSTILANVGDMGAADSAKAIISGVQAYDMVDGFSDVVDKAGALIDKYNEIGNTASITTAEIAQGVQSVGSVFADANTSVDEFIALLAAGNRQFQDADSLALGLRTAALRIRGCTAELQEMGEETEGVYTSASSLEKKIEGLTSINGKGGVKILEADGETFRSIYDIFLDISKVYQQMSDTDQSALLELISGKHRASAISATLNNMAEAQEIYQNSLSASGSAQREYDKYLESSEAALNRFKASMTETYQSVIDGKTVTGILNAGNAVLQFANSLGLVESTLRGFVLIGVAKGITTLSAAFKASAIQASNFGTALNSLKIMSSMARGTEEWTRALKMLKTVCSGLTETQLKLILSNESLSNRNRVAILQTTGLTKAQARAKLAEMGLTQATNAQTAANGAATASTNAQTAAQIAATTSTFSLKAAVTGLGASLKAAFMSNPIGIIIMGISTVIGIATSAFSKYKQGIEETRQKTKEAAETAGTLSSGISELAGKYISLSEAVKTDKSAKEELISTQEEIIKKLGLEGKSVDELIEKYGSLDNAIRQASLEQLGEAENELIAGVQAAKEELLEAGKDNWLGGGNTVSAIGKDAVKAWQVLDNAGIISSRDYTKIGGAWRPGGDNNTAEGILENYQKLQDAMDALKESGKFTNEELSENPVWKGIHELSNKLKGAVEGYNTSIHDLNANLAEQAMLKSLQGMELPDTEEEFESFRKGLVNSAVAGKEFIGSQEDIENAVNECLASVPQFSGYFTDPIREELEKADAVLDGENFTKKITSISEALSQSNGTEDGTWADDIEDYKEKLSSLQSYLEKFRDGSYTPEDLLSLADEFNIVGDTAEERISKVAALMQSETKKVVAIIDNIISAGNLDDATIAGLNEYKKLLQDICDIDLNGNVNFDLSDNPLADVQKLSDGLDQLDKIYADILDKEDFDWSSILNNDGFREAFSVYTEEYDNFINTVSSSPNDINACQDAFNKLTAAYIKGSGVLSEVTEATKAGTIALLEQMGVSNAASIVEQALIENEKMLAAQKYATAQGCDDLRKATYEEINALIVEGKTSEEVLKYLAKLALEKWELSKTELKTQADCDNLLNLAKHAGATAEQIKNLKNAMADLNTFDYTNPIGSAVGSAVSNFFEEAAEKNPALKKTKLYKNFAKNKKKQDSAQSTVKDIVSDIEDNLRKSLEIPEFKVDYTGGTTTRDTRERLAKEKEKEDKKKEETAENIDFIEIKLNNLIDTASRAKDKISDLLSFGAKKKQTQKAIEATTKALEAEYKAMKQYAKFAESFSADAAKETVETVTEDVSSAVNDAVSNIASSTAGVVNDAMQYVGKLPYIWGGTSLTNGADCSGFTQQLYRAYGINLDRTAQAQYDQNIGVKVTKDQLQPGDMVFFNGYKGAGGVGHVGIYIGGGQFVHEPGSGQTAKVSYLSDRKDFVGGKRFGNINNTPSSSVPSTVSNDTSSTTTTYTKVVPGIDSKTLAHYQKLVREGSFDIETITNEKLKNAIKSYQEWYEKMKSCRDKIDELNNDLKELYKTMAQIPIEKRDKNVETLDTRLDILNSKRENISAVIVDPKKYASTKKTLKSSKTDVKKGLKGLRTKAQMKSAGLEKTDIDAIKKQIKNGQTIPAKILDKITDGAFYEQCKQYNDAVYEHSQYAKTMRTAGDSIKKFNTISDQILSAEKSKTKQFKTAYNDVSKSYGKSLDNVKSKGNKTRKAFGSKKFGLTDADIKRIKSCISAGKQIPTDLMAQLESQSVYDSCVEYNKAVMENEAFREQLDNARFDLQKQQQAETAARLQNKTEKHQNIADKASAKMERNEALAENADTPKKKNKYLSQNLDLLQTEYKHLIKIAELENDSVKAAKLRAELEKETADIIEQQFQNISDYYSARRDKISDKESLQDVRYENAQADVKKKNDILNVKTRFATERNAESEQEYTDTAKLFNSNRTDAKKAVNKVKKLSSSDKDKILKLMESKEEIPENLMDKVAKLDPDAYKKLLNYNDSLDWLEKAALNKKISNEELIKTKRENEIQKHQNVADRAQDKMDKNDALSEISASASEQNKYEKENIKYLNTQYKHLFEIAKLHEDDVEYARLEAEQQAKIAEAYKAMFDNVKTEFENKISLISNDISDLDNEIKKVEASGRLVDASYYNHKISFENESLAKLKEEETSLVEQLKNIQMFSPAWYECQDAIQSVQNAQADSLSKVKEYKDAINEIADTIQNDIVDAFHDVTDEADLLITLLGDDLSDEDTGALTKDGLAVLSLYVSQMNICGEAAEIARKQIDSMKTALESGTLSFIDVNGVQREYESVYELKKALSEVQKIHMDEIKHKYDYGSKIVDMMIKKYQSELDYLKELIEKKKAELDAEKDLHDYAKSLKEQTDNINSLRKQIAALNGDTSNETKSKIQKLQSQLKDAEESLESDEYQRYISDQQDILNNLYDEYAKLIDDVMKDHDRLLREGLDLFAQTASDVQDVIKITAEEHGYEITGEMEKIITSIEGMGHLDSYLGVGGTVTQSLSDIVNEVHNAYVGISAEFQGLKDAIASIGYQGKYDTSDTDHTDYSINDSSNSTVNTGSPVNTNTPSNGTPDIDVSNLPDIDFTGLATKRFIEDLLKNGTNTDYDPKKASSLNKYIYGKYGSALTVDEMAKLSEYLGFNYTAKQLATENPNHSKRKMKMLEKLKEFEKTYGFSNGGIVPDDALKLKDLGINRASNGDTVLGTLKPKESVFNEKQTKMIQEYVNKGPDLESLRKLTPVLDKMMKMPEIEKRDMQTQNAYFGDVSFNLPNVMSYADFMNQAKKDPNFEEMIARIMRHQLGFGSYLKKTNVTFRN